MRNKINTNRQQYKETFAAYLREFLIVFALTSAGLAIGNLLAALLVAAMLNN